MVIQSLWHLASFRNNFLSCAHHAHSDRELVLRRKRSLLHAELAEQRGDEESKDNEASATPEEVLAAQQAEYAASSNASCYDGIVPEDGLPDPGSPQEKLIDTTGG